MMHNPGSHGDLVGVRSSEALRAVLQLQSPSGRYSMQFPGSMRQQMHNPGSHGQQLRTSANRSTPGRVQLRSMRDGLEFPRVINADRASSCDPYGRGLDAQPWIPVPEVCTTPDSRPAVCRRLQTFGERLQTKASSCDPLRAGTRCSPPDGSMGQQLRTSANRSAPSRLAVAIHGDLVVVRSSDQLRAGPAAAIPKGGDSMHNHGSQCRKYAQPRIQGQQYADVCIHLENVCKPRSAAAIPAGRYSMQSP